jgi:AcrR family transcriptional regulator
VPDDRKDTQRQRLLTGMIEVAGRDGYAGASIAQVVAHAGVSRPTFYDYFTDKDDCFLAALAEIHERLLADVRRAVARSAPQDAVLAAIGAVIELARAEPAMARALMNEAAASEARARDARDRGTAAIEQVVEDAYGQIPPEAPAPDVSARMLIGGVYRMLSSRLRHGEVDGSGLLEELGGWLRSYEHAISEHRWRGLSPMPPAPPATKNPPLLRPKPLAGVGARHSTKEVAENQRQRIVFAAAELAAEEGYGAATMAKITERAGVDTRALHRLFAGRQEVFAAVHELHFQHIMSVTAGAFFADGSWPERVWAAGLALTQAIDQNATLARVGLVEAYAGESLAVERVDQLGIAFTFFLREGYEYEPAGPALPRGACGDRGDELRDGLHAHARRGELADARAAPPRRVPGARAVPGRRRGQPVHRGEAAARGRGRVDGRRLRFGEAYCSAASSLPRNARGSIAG